MRPFSSIDAAKVPCKRHDRPGTTTDKAIFYYLGSNHVFFKREQRQLYFANLEQPPVMALLQSLDQESWRRDVVLETLYLDVHRYLCGGYRLQLPERLCKPLLVALRLKGVVISYALEDAVPVPAAGPDPDTLPG
ncbi:MAG: hypothetical protein R3E89_12100 [Thiolinea sp.]